MSTQKSTVNSNLIILDTLRGIAAIYVLVGHARWLLWEGYNFGYKLHPQSYNVLDKMLMYFFALFQFGHQAVLFFFVLSGFVIHWSTSNRVDRENKFDIWFYLTRRFRRLYPPLLLTILTTFILDRIGLYFHFPVYFSHTPYPSINENIHPDLSLTTLIGNLTFLQRVYTPVWGTNGALWSLMYEWWFYIIYIPVIFLFRKNKVLTSLLILALWIVSVEIRFSPVLLSTVLTYFISWYAGVLLADQLLYRATKLWQPVAFLAIVLALSVTRYRHSLGGDIALSVAIVALLYFLLTSSKFAFLGKLQGLGSFSYTLYVFHLPLICLLSGWVMYSNGGNLPSHSFYIFLGVAAALPLAWLLHYLVEKPFITKHKPK